MSAGSQGGLLSFEVSTPDAPEPLTELTEEDDMLRIDFECHPTEPVKVLDNWTGPVRCLCCGETAA